MLGHSDLKTTKGYLHSTEKTIRDIGKKISERMQQEPEKII
jgi:site-specific recombinase XerD